MQQPTGTQTDGPGQRRAFGVVIAVILVILAVIAIATAGAKAPSHSAEETLGPCATEHPYACQRQKELVREHEALTYVEEREAER